MTDNKSHNQTETDKHGKKQKKPSEMCGNGQKLTGTVRNGQNRTKKHSNQQKPIETNRGEQLKTSKRVMLL